MRFYAWFILVLLGCQSTPDPQERQEAGVQPADLGLVLQPQRPLKTTEWLPAAVPFKLLVAENIPKAYFQPERFEIIGWDMNHDRKVDMVDVFERKTGQLNFSVYRRNDTWHKVEAQRGQGKP